MKALWRLVRSGETRGGVNLVCELGLFGGLAGSALTFALVGNVFRRLYASGYAVLWWPVLLVLVLGFLRADIYNVSLKLWAIFILTAAYILIFSLQRRKAQLFIGGMYDHSLPHSESTSRGSKRS